MVRNLIVFTSGGMVDPASRIRGYYMAKNLSENGYDVEVYLKEGIEGNIVKRGLHFIPTHKPQNPFFSKICARVHPNRERARGD